MMAIVVNFWDSLVNLKARNESCDSINGSLLQSGLRSAVHWLELRSVKLVMSAIPQR